MGRKKGGESRAHSGTANRIAHQLGVDYNRGKGPDVKAPDVTVEVETADTVADAARQLRGFRGPVYVAGTSQEAVNKALDQYGDSTIGVMDKDGNIVKPSSRRR